MNWKLNLINPSNTIKCDSHYYLGGYQKLKEKVLHLVYGQINGQIKRFGKTVESAPGKLKRAKMCCRKDPSLTHGRSSESHRNC